MIFRSFKGVGLCTFLPYVFVVRICAAILLVVFAGGLIAQETDWIVAGNRAWDNGSPAEAAVDYARALDIRVRAGAPANELLPLRITLATACLEAGEYHQMEEVLQVAQKTAWPVPPGVSRAELLNAWSALHMKLGQLTTAEAELKEARRMVVQLTNPGDVLPTVLHNLAAVEMRTGRYDEALGNEREALQIFGKTMPPDHPTMIRGWTSLASLQYVMGQTREARSSMEQALALAERAYGPTHPMLADLLESDALILDKLNLKKEAKLVRKHARQIHGGPPPARRPESTNLVKPSFIVLSLPKPKMKASRSFSAVTVTCIPSLTRTPYGPKTASI